MGLTTANQTGWRALSIAWVMVMPAGRGVEGAGEGLGLEDDGELLEGEGVGVAEVEGGDVGAEEAGEEGVGEVPDGVRVGEVAVVRGGRRRCGCRHGGIEDGRRVRLNAGWGAAGEICARGWLVCARRAYREGGTTRRGAAQSCRSWFSEHDSASSTRVVAPLMYSTPVGTTAPGRRVVAPDKYTTQMTRSSFEMPWAGAVLRWTIVSSWTRLASSGST